VRLIKSVPTTLPRQRSKRHQSPEKVARVAVTTRTHFRCFQTLEEGVHSDPAITITRKDSLFAGSDSGARHWAIANTLNQSCKLNDVEPLAYLTDVMQRIVSGRTKRHELHSLQPWNWHADHASTTTAA
jgi:hypothetical protein